MSLPFEINSRRDASRQGTLITSHGPVETPVFMPVGTQATVKGVSQDMLEELGVEILLGNTYHLYLRPGIEQIRTLGGLHRFMSWGRAILADSGGFQVFSLSDLRKVSEEGVAFRSHLDGSPHFLTPEKAIEAQVGLGADIIMVLDECTEYPAEASRVRESMEMTLRWAKRSKRCFDEHKLEIPWNRHQPSAMSHRSWFDSLPSIAVSEQTGTAEPSASGEAKSWSGIEKATQALFGIVQGGMDLALRKESS